MKKKMMGKNRWRKTNSDSCNSPVGESFCLVFIQKAEGWAAPSLRQCWFPGRERSDGRRVLTTLPNCSHRSSLVRCCLIVETRHSSSSAGRCMRLQGRMRADKCVCVTVCVCARHTDKEICEEEKRKEGGEEGWCASFTQLCHSFRLSKYHSCVWGTADHPVYACVGKFTSPQPLCSAAAAPNWRQV